MQGKRTPVWGGGVGESLASYWFASKAVRSIMLSVDWCLRSQPLLIISSFGEEGVRAVGGRSSLINGSDHSERTLLRVIKVNLDVCSRRG